MYKNLGREIKYDSDKEIIDFFDRLDIMIDYCQSRKKEIEEKCLGNLKNKEAWKFVIDEVRLASVNLFNTNSDYAYILSFFNDKDLADKIIEFDIKTDKYIQRHEKNEKKIDTITNAICSSEYMYILFNKAGKIEFEKKIEDDRVKGSTFVLDSSLIVLDYFKALELYLAKKIYTKFNTVDKISNKINDGSFFDYNTIGEYINYIGNNVNIKFNSKLIKDLKKIKNNYRNVYAHKCYLVKDSETTEIRLRICKMIKELDEEFDKYSDCINLDE